MLLYSIILVEDDFTERSILKKLILSTYKFINIYEADSEISALNIIKENHINLFFIDIDLKESSGLELAIKIRDIPEYQFKQIIFLASYMEHIIQAFKQIHCYEYILKPYNKKNIQAVLNKLIPNENNNLNDDLAKDENEEIIIILKNGAYAGIKLNEIVFIEVIGKNCEINTISGMYIANKISLKKILKLINCKCIIQSHRAFAINTNYICKIEKLDRRLSILYFNKYSKTALLGYKFKDSVTSEFKKGKVIID